MSLAQGRASLRLLGLAVVMLVTAAAAAARQAPGLQVIALEGLPLPGSDGLAVASLGMPVGNGIGGWAFTGVLEDGDGFVWHDGGLIWRNSSADRPRPVGAAPFMGVGDDGEFVFRTVVAGEEALWSHNGSLIRAGEQAPGFDPGVWIEFNRRAMMTPGGTAFWVSGFRDGKGVDGEGRVLYASPDASPDNIQVVLRSDDLVEGIPISRPFGLDIEFRVSRNLEHMIHPVILDTGSTLDDGALYVDGAIVAREGESAGLGLVWNRFQRVTINNGGDYLFSAVVDNSPRSRLVLAYNGQIQVREGQQLDGSRLRRPASVLGLDIDDSGRAVHLWSTDGFGPELLYFACDAEKLRDSQLLLMTPAAVDPMTKLLGFSDTGHGPVFWLGDDDTHLRVGVELLMILEGEPHVLEAIVSVELPRCP